MEWFFKSKKKIEDDNLVSILETIKGRITEGSDLTWTSYESDEKLRKDIEGYVNQLIEGDYSCIEELNLHFVASGTFQEHSISNGWTDEYVRLAAKFDKIYLKLKS